MNIVEKQIKRKIERQVEIDHVFPFYNDINGIHGYAKFFLLLS